MRINWYLFPFAIVYWLIVGVRNKLFDIDVLKSESFDKPIICVGNISVGGTGKTPHIEYLISWLKAEYQLATLSRGYKRKTKGFVIATDSSTVNDVGDEPLQIKNKFSDITVAVNEKRVDGIQNLLKQKKIPQVILLDDAYQHRHLKAGLNILLVDCNRLITKDFMLPVGRLREPAHNHSRAELIIVTKCSDAMQPIDFRIMRKELKLFPYQKLFFTSFKYKQLVSVFNKRKVMNLSDLHGNTAMVVTGIANPKPIYTELKKAHVNVVKFEFADHHAFTSSDVQKIIKRFAEIKETNKVLICTEKDATRLKEMGSSVELTKLPLYCLPIQVSFLNGGETEFQEHIQTFIHRYIKE